MVRSFSIAVLLTLFLDSTLTRHADAQTPRSNVQRIADLARRLEATQAELKQTQTELHEFRQLTANAHPDTLVFRSLPPVDQSTRWVNRVGDGAVQSHDMYASAEDTCPDCGKEVCWGVPHVGPGCQQQLSWSKGGFRIVPYGAVVAEMIGSDKTVVLRGSPLYLVPGPAPNIDDSRFSVSGQQSTFGLSITGPDLGPFQSGANVAVNFFGEQPIQNNPGLFFMFAFAELKNDLWHFWVGQAPDAIGRQNSNSPAWSSHKMSGNFGQLRPGFRAERFFHHSDVLSSSVYVGLTQQAVNDFIAVTGVSGIDSGWPNVETRWEVQLGPAENGQQPFLFAIGGLIGETRAVDDLAMSASNESTSWAVIPELRFEFERWGFQGEWFVGQAIGTYNGAIGQSLNPIDGESIYSVGGFGEVFWKLTPCFTTSMGYGIDNPRNRDLGTLAGGMVGQRSRNEKYWLNFIWRFSDEWETRFEVSHLETTYLAPSNDSESILYHALVRYIF